MRALIDIKQIDISKLNDVKIYDELPLEVEGQVAYCQGKLYYGDGSEWNEISVGGSALPEGTVNQTLRHNGTEWVANSTLEISDGTVTIPCIGYQGAIDYNRTVLFNYQSVQGFSFSDIAGGAFNLSHGLDNGGWGKLELSGQNGNYIVELSTLQDDYFIVGYNQSSNAEFMISSECVMRLSSLRGTGTSILEATDVGTVQRSTMPIVKAKIVDRVLTEDTFIFYYTSDDLGIEPDLRDKIISFEVYRKRAEQDFYSTGVVTLADKQLSYDSISFYSNDGITAGDTVRVAVAYIDGIPDTSVPNAPVMIGYDLNGFVVSWGMVQNATSYELQYSPDGSDWSEAYGGADNMVHYFPPQEGWAYFRCRASNSNGYGEYSAVLKAGYYQQIPPPSNVEAEIYPLDTNNLILTWDEVPSATVYKIYTSVVPIGAASNSFVFLGKPKVNNYSCEIERGKRHYFKLTAENTAQWSQRSEAIYLDVY